MYIICIYLCVYIYIHIYIYIYMYVIYIYIYAARPEGLGAARGGAPAEARHTDTIYYMT